MDLPLEEYPSMKDFFVRKLREGSRPIDKDPQCLVTGNSFLVSIVIYINLFFICPGSYIDARL